MPWENTGLDLFVLTFYNSNAAPQIHYVKRRYDVIIYSNDCCAILWKRAVDIQTENDKYPNFPGIRLI